MLQEELTSAIADIIDKMIQPIGIMVIVSAQHTCMMARGRFDYSQMTRVYENTVTSALRGVMLSSEGPRLEAIALLSRR